MDTTEAPQTDAVEDRERGTAAKEETKAIMVIDEWAEGGWVGQHKVEQDDANVGGRGVRKGTGGMAD